MARELVFDSVTAVHITRPLLGEQVHGDTLLFR